MDVRSFQSLIVEEEMKVTNSLLGLEKGLEDFQHTHAWTFIRLEKLIASPSTEPEVHHVWYGAVCRDCVMWRNHRVAVVLSLGSRV